MATNTLKRLFQVQLTNADAQIYIAPALTTAVVIALYKANVDSSQRTFRLYHVPAGGTIAITRALYYDEPIPATRVHPRIDSGIILEPGQSLRGLASAGSAITLTGFGITTEESA